MTTRFDTIPVAGDKLKAGERGHIIAINDVIATIVSKEKTDKGEYIVKWAQIDCPIDEAIDGIIHVPDGATVDCIRVSDWLNGHTMAEATR